MIDYKLRCAKCGNHLTYEEERKTLNSDLPGACSKCYDAVIDEIMKDYSMWPSHWFGHWSENPEGQWMYEPPGAM